LCDLLPEDRVLREKLQQNRLVRLILRDLLLLLWCLSDGVVVLLWCLSDGVVVLLWCLSDSVVVVPQEEVLEQQQQERDDSSFHRLCMFCSEEFSGNR